jgi:streptogramin lyase
MFDYHTMSKVISIIAILLLTTGLLTSSVIVSYAQNNATGQSGNGDTEQGTGQPPSSSPQANKVNYCFSYIFGSKGTGDGQFVRPHDVDFNSKGTVYVTDRERNDVQIFDKNGTFIKVWGGPGSDPGQFDTPYSLEVDSSDNIYVVDRGNDRVQKFDPEGNFIAQFTETGVEGGGEENGRFVHPEDIAIDHQSGMIYVADAVRDIIIKFDKDFNYISHIGSEDGDTGEGVIEFSHPHGIDIDSQDNIYVNDLDNPQIQKFNENGTFVKKWGSLGTGPGQFTPPLEHLEVDDNTDRVFMVDGEDNPRVQIFDTEGNFLASIGTKGSGDGQFEEPEHVNISEDGLLYIVDRGNGRIQVFSPC